MELGQEVEAKVLDVNATARRISLSIRAMTEPEITETEDDYNDDYSESASVKVDIDSYK